jgi:enoyl-CoA hydratase/carnithine racemase
MLPAECLIRREGRAGRITLNRPEALNALTYGMIGAISEALGAWRADPAVEVIVLDGAGGRALCAGGDVISLYNASPKGAAPDAHFAMRFWRDEYILNAAIARYPKPYVAIMDGIVMGGGVGLSAHGRHRVVTEKTMVAMPETAIGLIPDVGGTWLLGHAQGRMGEYLGLTGQRMDGSDAIQAGFADTFLPRDQIAGLVERLADPDGGAIEDVMDRAAETPVPASKLAEAQGLLKQIFSGGDVGEIRNNAARLPDAVARKVSGDLASKSPKAMALALAAIRLARTLPSLEQALVVEYRLVTRLYRDGEFIEGIRALLVDKDKAPRWNPASGQTIETELIARYLAPLEAGEDLQLTR